MQGSYRSTGIHETRTLFLGTESLGRAVDHKKRVPVLFAESTCRWYVSRHGEIGSQAQVHRLHGGKC
jgi:hypothetical protein